MSELCLAQLATVVRWCVLNEGECIGDHPVVLKQAKAALAAISTPLSETTSLKNAAPHGDRASGDAVEQPRSPDGPIIGGTSATAVSAHAGAAPASTDKLHAAGEDTPRTNAVLVEGHTLEDVYRLLSHARQLERELAEARMSAALHENAAGHLAQMAVDAVAPSAGVSITLPELATVEMQEVICDHIFGDWRREDLATQARCKSEAVDLYNAIVTFGTRSAIKGGK